MQIISESVFFDSEKIRTLLLNDKDDNWNFLEINILKPLFE